MMAYHFKDWERIYENNKSREVETLSYFLQPNKLVGECLGFTKMQPDGLELLGTLMFLKCVASTAQPAKWRGWFVRNGSVMDATRIAALAGIPVEKVQRALSFFSTAPMDWLLHEEWPDSKAAPNGHRKGTPAAPNGHRKGSKSAGLRTDKGLTETEERENNGGFATPEEARRAQATQFAACSARLKDLEAIPEDDRTAEDEEELKKMRGILKKIQKKQSRNDFTPVADTGPVVQTQ